MTPSQFFVLRKPEAKGVPHKQENNSCKDKFGRTAAKRSQIQLFRKRLSEKVHATIPKGIVGGFEFTLLLRNLKERHERPWTYVCEC